MTPTSLRPALLALLALLALSTWGCTADEAALGTGRTTNPDTGVTPDAGEPDADETDADEPDAAEPDDDASGGDRPCEETSECPSDAFCVFHRGETPPLYCDSAAGAGGGGASCSADAECRSGLCLEGRCAEPCGGDSACPDGQRCEDTDVGGGVVIGVCSPDTCASPDGCEGGEVCWATRGAESLEFTCQTSGNPNGGALGERCAQDAECLGNLCESGRCAGPCAAAAECIGAVPLGCEVQEVAVGSGAVEASICVGPDACDRDSACDASSICFVQRGQRTLETFCAAGNEAPGRRPPLLCDADAECLHGLCLNGQCASPCVESADCEGGLACASRVVTLPGGNASVQVCVLPPEETCQRDGECRGGEVCAAIRRGDRVDFACGDGNPGGGDSGAGCSADAECLHNLCLDGACAEPCALDNDCTDQLCGAQRADTEQGAVNVQVCTAPEPCQAARQCDADQTCYVRDVGAQAVETVCLAPNSGGRTPGMACAQDSQCASNLCLTEWVRTACSAPCEVNADCPAGWSCLSREVRGSAESALNVCVPPPPTPCQSNTDCAGLHVCSVVVNRAGDGLDSVCVDPAGPGTPGASCSADAQCRAGICLNGACSGLCRDAAVCGLGQLCLEGEVTRGGLSDTFNLCTTLPDEACGATRECSDGVRVCGDLRSRANEPTQPYCIQPQAGGDPIGTACTGARSPNSQCYDRICLTNATNACTTTCLDAQDCVDAGAPAGYVCTDFSINASTVRMCAEGCGNDAGCGRADHLCGLSRNVTDDRFEFICRIPLGTDPIGTPCPEDGDFDCDHGICLIRSQNGAEVERVCTQPCEADTDCPSGWVCDDANIATPRTGASQGLRVCTRE